MAKEDLFEGRLSKAVLKEENILYFDIQENKIKQKADLVSPYSLLNLTGNIIEVTRDLPQKNNNIVAEGDDKVIVKINPCEKTNFDVDLETYMESEMSNPLDFFIKVDFGHPRTGLPKINLNQK